MKQLFYFILTIFLTSCIDKKIEITSEYIINENWNEIANAIKINRMRLKKDSTIDLSNLNQVDIVNRLEEDSSFIYYANVKLSPGDSYKKKKIYFNRDNGFFWGGENPKDKTRVIGNLEKGYWYKLSRLVTYSYYVFVYIDRFGNVHRQDVNVSNY